MNDKLVTLLGGGGFVGRYVAQALLATGARVRIAQRDPRQAFFLKPLGGLGQTQFIGADVTKPETIAHAVHGSDVVVNLVGVLAGDFHTVQTIGAKTVAEAAAKATVEKAKTWPLAKIGLGVGIGSAAIAGAVLFNRSRNPN